MLTRERGADAAGERVEEERGEGVGACGDGAEECVEHEGVGG